MMKEVEMLDAEAVTIDANVRDLLADAAKRRGIEYGEFILLLFNNAADEEYAIQQCEDNNSAKCIH